MEDNHLMINKKKLNADKGANKLVGEYLRDEETAYKYDTPERILYESRSGDNVVLRELELEEGQTYDQKRKERWEYVNQARKALGQRGLKKSTVSNITYIVDAGKELMDSMTHEEQIKFFEDCLEVMENDPEQYGKIDYAVIHFDETRPHMQVIADVYDYENYRSRAQEMFGNKTKMSADQTKFVEAVKEKGYDVKRGVQRVGGTYPKWAKQQEERYGGKITRHNEHLYQQAEQLTGYIADMNNMKQGRKAQLADCMKDLNPDFELPRLPKAKRDKGEEPKPINTDEGYAQFMDQRYDVMADLFRIEAMRRVKEMHKREREAEQEKQQYEQKQRTLDATLEYAKEKERLADNSIERNAVREKDLNSRESTLNLREHQIDKNESDLTQRISDYNAYLENTHDGQNAAKDFDKFYEQYDAMTDDKTARQVLAHLKKTGQYYDYVQEVSDTKTLAKVKVDKAQSYSKPDSKEFDLDL